MEDSNFDPFADLERRVGRLEWHLAALEQIEARREAKRNFRKAVVATLSFCLLLPLGVTALVWLAVRLAH